ncbi:PepSY domain-containing protein [Salinimonas lutimaris]|uniref:PepSY domain-containing protein n=1 Tax=Salinimonas lutimaris TaxID=914153 RepID=UPI00158697E4
MLLVGVQFVIWMLSGVYMVITDIHEVHGEHLITKQSTFSVDEVLLSPGDIMAQYPLATKVRLTSRQGRPVYIATFTANSDKPALPKAISAVTGEALAVVNEAAARDIAASRFTGAGGIAAATLIESQQNLPEEVSGRYLPFWRIDFDTPETPTFYVQQNTGEVVTVRYDGWRSFDWMWRFHIMDLDDGRTIGNFFLLSAIFTGLLAALSGAGLSYWRVCRPLVKGEDQ